MPWDVVSWGGEMLWGRCLAPWGIMPQRGGHALVRRCHKERHQWQTEGRHCIIMWGHSTHGKGQLISWCVFSKCQGQLWVQIYTLELWWRELVAIIWSMKISAVKTNITILVWTNYPVIKSDLEEIFCSLKAMNMWIKRRTQQNLPQTLQVLQLLRKWPDVF